ncbi:MAG: glycosyltransferase [Flavipsychrobacter sp.]|nr:glycosyltransferase [Flavipsychrobacter sp.]
MLVLFIVCFFLSMGYAALMVAYRYGWEEQPGFRLGKAQPRTRITVVIPARNEEANIGSCISSLLAQNYPKELLEIIVVSDHSTDHTIDVVEAFDVPNVRCLDLKDYLQPGEQIVAYKKKALSVAIAQSNGTLIVTTDADCTSPVWWLKNIAALYEAEDPVMIVAPVSFTSNGTMVETFQAVDFMSMQGITGAVHQLKMGSMSNGANLAFSRQAFDEVGGYEGIDHLASGDDYLLMVKLQQRYPGRISYLKSRDAIVTTPPQPGWRSFLRQRIRWASKSGKYDDGKMTAMLAFVYVYNLAYLVLAVLGLFVPFAWGVAALMLLLKVISELYYLQPVAAFFGRERLLRFYPLYQPLHIAYIIAAGLMGMAGKYQWKGRSVS